MQVRLRGRQEQQEGRRSLNASVPFFVSVNWCNHAPTCPCIPISRSVTHPCSTSIHSWMRPCASAFTHPCIPVSFVSWPSQIYADVFRAVWGLMDCWSLQIEDELESEAPSYAPSTMPTNKDGCRPTTRTKNGNAENADCAFPFEYKGKTHSACITIDNTKVAPLSTLPT